MKKKIFIMLWLSVLLTVFYGCSSVSGVLRHDIDSDALRQSMFNSAVPVFKMDNSAKESPKAKPNSHESNIEKPEEVMPDAKEKLLNEIIKAKDEALSDITSKETITTSKETVTASKETVTKSKETVTASTDTSKGRTYSISANNQSIRKVLMAIGIKYKTGMVFLSPYQKGSSTGAGGSVSTPVTPAMPPVPSLVAPSAPSGNISGIPGLPGNIVAPVERVMVSQVASAGSSDYDRILVNGFFNSDSLDGLISNVCAAGDVYCFKENEHYIVSKYESLVVPRHLFPTYTMNSTGSSSNTATGTDSSGTGSSGTGSSGTGSSGTGSSGTGSSGTGSSSQQSSTTSSSAVGMSFSHQENIDSIKSFLSTVLSSEGVISLNTSGLLVIEDRPSAIKKVRLLVSELKETEKEIRVNLQIINVRLKDQYGMGIKWDLVKSLSGQNMISVLGNNTLLSNKSFAFGLNDRFGNSALLTVLQEFGRAEVVRNWDVTLKSGIPSTFDIVRNVPYFTSQILARDSGSTSRDIVTHTVNYQSVGLKIRIFPMVDKEKRDLKGGIAIELSELDGFESTNDGQNKAPITSLTNVVVPLDIPYNHSYIISGFKVRSIDDSRDGLPFLSQIPILGGAFGSQSKKYENNEMLIVLTTI